MGGLYAAWILREAALTWTDASTGLKTYYALAFVCGASLAGFGVRQLVRPVRNRLARIASFALPALILANHSWARIENILLCSSPG